MLQILFFSIYYFQVLAQTTIELQVSKGDYYITQTNYYQMFELTINQEYDYIMIEVKMQDQDQQNVMLVYQQIGETKDQSSEKLVYDKIDNNGYALQKSYQYILVRNDEIDTMKRQYAGVFSTSKVSYKISATGYTNVKPCPHNCNSQGSCFVYIKINCKQSGKCLCNDGWIDEDCSIQATMIQIGSSVQISNYSSNISYAYYESTLDTYDALYLTFETTSVHNIQIDMLIADSIYLPTDKYSEQRLTLNNSNSPVQIVFKEEALQNYYQQKYRNKKRLLSSNIFQPSILVMSFQCINKDNINDTIKLSLNLHEDEENAILIIAIIFPVVFGIWAIALCYYCAKRIRNRRKLEELNQQIAIIRRLKIEQNINLDTDWKKSHEFIPILVTSNLTKIKEDQCSICLENLSKEGGVKQTPCGHFFHNNCIALWLENHPHCPLCRANLMIQDLISIEFKKIINDRI